MMIAKAVSRAQLGSRSANFRDPHFGSDEATLKSAASASLAAIHRGRFEADQGVKV